MKGFAGELRVETPTPLVVSRSVPLGGLPGMLLEVQQALHTDECGALIARLEHVGFQEMSRLYPPDYRDNDRLVFDDIGLAGQLQERLANLLPREIGRGDSRWQLVNLNERFRSCRYGNGQGFRTHRDGPYFRSADERSWLTVMAYLNDAHEFQGGRTRFYADRDPGSLIVATIEPQAGSLVVFDHSLWHDGEPVTEGRKYVLRTDVMYRRVGSGEPIKDGDVLPHPGYVWSTTLLSDGRLATGCRDGHIRLWRPSSSGWFSDSDWEAHPGSVTALAPFGRNGLAAGSRDGHVRLWHVGPTAQRLVVKAKVASSAILGLAAGSDGALLAALADGAWLRLDSTTGVAQRVESGRAWVWSIAEIGPGLIASASDDGFLRIWALTGPRGRPELVCAENTGAPLRALASDGADGAFATGDAHGQATVWTLQSGRLAPVARLHAHQGAVRAIEWMPGRLLATGGEDDCARIWDAGMSRCMAERRHGDFVTSLATLPDHTLASASYDGTVRIGRVGRCSSGAPAFAPRPKLHAPLRNPVSVR